MCNSYFKESNIEEKIEKFKIKELILEKLLRSKAYKYSDVIKINERRRKAFLGLNDSCGLYHFFYVENNIKYSLYLGKGAFGDGDDWCLYKRIIQHFQPSQPNTIHGKVKEKLNLYSNKDAINVIKQKDIYLQFVEIYNKSENMNWSDIDDEIMMYEKFCIEVLNPAFTDR